MRNFFIDSLDVLIGVVLVLSSIGVVIAAGAVVMGGVTGPGGQPVGGALAGLFILVFGAIYIMFIGGFLYLGLGIYYNTKRMADALESKTNL